MAIQEISPSLNISGRIGKGFAEGLSQQLPKEIANQRLSSTLRNLEKKPGTPISMYADLIASGANPQDINQILPYVQAQGVKKEAAGKNLPMQGSAGQPPNPTAQVSNDNGAGNGQVANSLRRSGTLEAYRQRGSEIAAERPLQFPTQQLAEAEAQREYETQQAQIAKVGKGFESVLTKKLHKDLTVSEVLGDLQQDFITQAEDAVLSGRMTEQQAANHFTKQALDFAKNRTNLENIGSYGINSSTAVANRRAIDATRKEYEKLGRLEEFKDDLKTYQGLSEDRAAELAFPVKSEPKIKSYLDSVNPTLAKRTGATEYVPFAGNKSVGKIADGLVPLITDKTSLSSIASDFNKKGYNGQDFLNEMNKKYKNGDLRLNERQVRELSKVTTRPTLGDWYFFTQAGEDPLGENND